MEKATKPINHAISLLRQVGEGRWEFLDTIADEADWKISEGTFAPLQNTTLLRSRHVNQPSPWPYKTLHLPQRTPCFNEPSPLTRATPTASATTPNFSSLNRMT